MGTPTPSCSVKDPSLSCSRQLSYPPSFFLSSPPFQSVFSHWTFRVSRMEEALCVCVCAFVLLFSSHSDFSAWCSFSFLFVGLASPNYYANLIFLLTDQKELSLSLFFSLPPSLSIYTSHDPRLLFSSHRALVPCLPTVCTQFSFYPVLSPIFSFLVLYFVALLHTSCTSEHSPLHFTFSLRYVYLYVCLYATHFILHRFIVLPLYRVCSCRLSCHSPGSHHHSLSTSLHIVPPNFSLLIYSL